MAGVRKLSDDQADTVNNDPVLNRTNAHRLDSSNSCNTYDFGFDNPQFSDRILHVHRERSAETGAEPSSAHADTPLLSMHVNSLTLAANSEIFRQKLEGWVDESGPKTLRLEVKPGEEILLQHLIRFCYSRQIDLTEEKPLLRLMQLADRFLMPDCVDICAAALAPQEGALSLQSAYRYLRLPAGLHTHEPFCQLVNRATARVQAEFDDLDAVWMSESLQADFLRLPLPALLTVLASPQLKTITENTVFVAVSHWMHKAAAKQKKSITSLEDTAQMLAQCIRFPMLTNDFLHFVTPQAAWLPNEYKSGSPFRDAARFKGAPQKLQQQLAKGPRAGHERYLPRRVGIGSSTCIMQWEVPITKISSIEREGPSSSLRIPGEYYLCGYYWYLILQYNVAGRSLGCYLHWTAKLDTLTELSPPEAFVMASVSVSVKNERWGPDFQQVAAMKREHSLGGGLGMGWGNPFRVALRDCEHESDLAKHLDLAGYVTEGFLDVQFTVDVRVDQ